MDQKKKYAKRDNNIASTSGLVGQALRTFIIFLHRWATHLELPISMPNTRILGYVQVARYQDTSTLTITSWVLYQN